MALEEGRINPDTTVKAAESTSWTPDISDWNAPPITRTNHPAGPVNLDRALVWSDNIYFAWAALGLSYETFESYAQKIGLGQPLSFEIPVSQSMVKERTRPGQTPAGYFSIGQEEVLMTPLQMAAMYTAFLNKGDMVLPQIV